MILKMRCYIIFFGLLLILSPLSSCDKNEVEVDVPGCIRDEIIILEMGTICENEASITRYDFQGKHVYVFYPGSCIADAFFDVYDSECNLICQLSGLAGVANCEGLNFSENATNPVIVWEN